MAYNVLDDLQPWQLRIMLDETQASLAASLARIESFKVENRLLANEGSNLRSSVLDCIHSSDRPSEGAREGGEKASGSGATAPGDADPAGADTGEPEPPAEPLWRSVTAAPVQISELEGQHPIEIVNGGKKEAANLLITRDFVEIVGSKAQIRAHEFVGMTSVQGSGEEGGCHEGDEGRGRWQIIWNKDNMAQRLVLETSKRTKESFAQHTARWLGLDDNSALEDVVSGDAGETVPPHHMYIGEPELLLSGAGTQIMSPTQMKALASSLPPMERMRPWSLTYSSTRHGISLSTLYRRQQDKCPTITLIKDSGGHIFGAYTPDSWKVSPRFYSSGETFVFQLAPHMVSYPWRSLSNAKNDFFMYATPDCLAVGGLGHFAIHLDSELLQGSSGNCGTFGSPSLSCKEDFKVMAVEIWQAN